MLTTKSICSGALVLIGLIGHEIPAVRSERPNDGPVFMHPVQPGVSGALTGRVTADKSRYNAVGFTVKLYNSGWSLLATKTYYNYVPLSEGDYVDYSFDGLPPGYYYVWAEAAVLDHDFWTPIYGLNTVHPWCGEYYPDSFTKAGATQVYVADGSVTANINLVLEPVSYIQMGTNPGAQPFEVDGVVYTTSPTYFEWRRGEAHTLSVEEYYENPNGTRCYFREWRQGGPRIQTYAVPPGKLIVAQGMVVDTLIARFNYFYILEIFSAHGNPRGAGWLEGWTGTTISVEPAVVEKIPPHVFPAKALTRTDTDSVRYVFERWKGTGAGSYSGTDNPAVVTMNFNVTEEAFWKTQFPLVFRVSHTSMGAVSVDPPGLWQDRDSLVSVKAVPMSGFAFAGWEGSISESADSVAFIMDTSKVVLARFVRALHPPVITLPDSGFAEDDTLFLSNSELDSWISDTLDPSEDLTIHLESGPGLLHSREDSDGVRLWTDPDWNGTGWVVINVLDPEGSSAFDTLHVRIRAVDDPPDPFDLLSPPSDFEVADSTVELKFVWGTSRNRDAANGDAIRYAFCFGRKGAKMDTLSVTSDTSFVLPGPDLPANGDYFWKVLALDEAGNPAWSLSERKLSVAIQSGVKDRRGIPVKYGLAQNYPNPFNPSTEIGYALPEKGRVRIEIYSPSGKRIRTLVNSDRPPGEYTAVWDGTDDSGRRVGSGIYVCRMTAGRFSKSIKMTVMK